MIRNVLRTIYYIQILGVCLLLIGCKQKADQVQDRLQDIEHYQIDTIEAKPLDKPAEEMTHSDSCRAQADMVLRKYPEAYHAADKVRALYEKWLERELNFINMVFVGKDANHLKVLKRNNGRLKARLEQMNFIDPLNHILNNGTVAAPAVEPQLTTIPDENAFTESYRKTIFAIKDALKGDKTVYSTDEMRTASEKARRAWLEYIAALPNLYKVLPADCVEPMTQAMNRILSLHYIDLRNCYFSYWSDVKAGWLLQDNCTDETLNQTAYEAFHYCEWMQ